MICVFINMTGTPEGSTESGFMEKSGIEPATPGLQGIALIHYTTGAFFFFFFAFVKTWYPPPLDLGCGCPLSVKIVILFVGSTEARSSDRSRDSSSSSENRGRLHWSVRTLVKSAYQKSIFYFLTKTYVVGTQKNRLNETVLLST